MFRDLIADIERGVVDTPRPGTIRLLATVLQVDPSELGQDSPNPGIFNGRKLQRIRMRQRLMTREELAERMGSHLDHIAKLERGDIANPRPDTVNRLAAALEVDPLELFDYE